MDDAQKRVAELEDVLTKILSSYAWEVPEKNDFYNWMQKMKLAGATPDKISFPLYVNELIRKVMPST